jgi:alcohol dehydrogenase, propanol-preferring
VESLGGRFVDFSKSANIVEEVISITQGGAHAAIVTSGSPKAFSGAVDMLRIGGTLCCIGIPPGDIHLTTPIATLIIRGLKVVGNLVGSMDETLEAVELVRKGEVKPHVEVREFEELPEVYEILERGDILGRIVLKVAK